MSGNIPTSATISQLHAVYKAGSQTVEGVTLAHLEKIAMACNGVGHLNAVSEINPDAIHIAQAMQAGENMLPLFGVPVLIKDNIDTGDKMRTTAGSVALAGNYALRDAFVTSLLRRAGAVIIGKANMTEFANYMSDTGMPSGYSSRGGQVLHPHNDTGNPSGSSSGSAVAVASGMCTVSIGTETLGSIISPAGECAIVGIKPTHGLVSGQGIIPIARTLDTAGPMARNVRNAATLLGVMAETCYSANMQRTSLSGMRIGVNRSAETAPHFAALCDMFVQLGAIIVEDVTIDGDFREVAKDIMRYEFKACINHYLAGTNAGVKNLADIIAYNQDHAEVALKYGQGILLDAQYNTSGNCTDAAYINALLARHSLTANFNNAFCNVDVLLGDSFVYKAPVVGFPTISVPMGKIGNARAAITAPKYSEALLIRIGIALEDEMSNQ